MMPMGPMGPMNPRLMSQLGMRFPRGSLPHGSGGAGQMRFPGSYFM